MKVSETVGVITAVIFDPAMLIPADCVLSACPSLTTLPNAPFDSTVKVAISPGTYEALSNEAVYVYEDSPQVIENSGE